MKRYLYLLLATIMLTVASPLSTNAKRVVVPKMYMFGFAASFNDTIVYFTDIQAIDSAWIEKKSGFLQSRNVYTSQMRTYLNDELSMPHRTCVVFYSTKRAKVEKKYLKMRHKYGHQKDGSEHFDVRYITEDQMRFRPVDLTGLDEAELAQQAEDEEQEKVARQERKQQKKQQKQERKAGRRGK